MLFHHRLANVFSQFQRLGYNFYYPDMLSISLYHYRYLKDRQRSIDPGLFGCIKCQLETAGAALMQCNQSVCYYSCTSNRVH